MRFQARSAERYLLLIVAAFAVAAIGLLPALRGSTPESLVPTELGLTGLYSDFASKTVDPVNMAYTPQYPLWSDGASKLRWIFIPRGRSIDASDPDVWDFPIGTKVWKEFSFHGHRVETRLIERVEADEWRFASYAWNADESRAVLVPEAGLRDVAEIRPGLRHDIPGILDCKDCHVNQRPELLGFSALQLSPDRDPAAPHAEKRLPGMIDLMTLIDRGLIRSFPQAWRDRPPRIEAQSSTSRAALGYLHANCGNCHNAGGSLDVLNLLLRHSMAAAVSGEPALKTGLNKTGNFRIPGTAPGETFLIKPGDPEHSAVVYRMSTRNPLYQMPPLGTKLADAEAVDLVRRWIGRDMSGEGRAPAGPVPDYQ
jgi:hypothetical protein